MKGLGGCLRGIEFDNETCRRGYTTLIVYRFNIISYASNFAPHSERCRGDVV
jgi:hypothetical protein